MIIKDLLFLATEHNVSNAYLNVMFELNLMPEMVLLLKPKRQASSIKSFIDLIAGRKSRVSEYARTGRLIYKKVWESIAPSCFAFDDMSISIEQLFKKHKVRYKVVETTDINDLELLLKNGVKQKYCLYTSGGIIKRRLFETGKKFIHIHPGVVPYVKGSNCILWSALVRKKIGMSCFFMNTGIDTGDLIASAEFQLPSIELDSQYLNHSDYSDILYKAVDEYIDPCYRGEMLKKVLETDPEINNWKSARQDMTEGKTYYSIHSRLRDKSVAMFFNSGKDSICL